MQSSLASTSPHATPCESVSNWHPFPLTSWHFFLFVRLFLRQFSFTLSRKTTRDAPPTSASKCLATKAACVSAEQPLCLVRASAEPLLCSVCARAEPLLCSLSLSLSLCTEQLLGVVSAQRSAFHITILFLSLLLLMISFVCAWHSLCLQTHASCSLCRPCKARLCL